MAEIDATRQQVVAIRKKFGWSQSDLAKHLSVSQATISIYERGADVLPVVEKAAAQFARMVDAGMIRASDLFPENSQEGAPK